MINTILFDLDGTLSTAWGQAAVVTMTRGSRPWGSFLVCCGRTWVGGGGRREDGMASLMDRIKAYLHSPKGRQTVEQGKRMARDPRNQQKARRFLDKFRSKRH